MKAIYPILFILFIFSCHSKVPSLNEQIGEKIFHNARPYVLYVCDYVNSKYMEIFEEYCLQNDQCAVLDGSNDMHRMLTQFVGMNSDQYLLILNAQNFQKFTLELNDSIKAEDIENFFESFKAGTLPRFYSSEAIPTKENDPHLRKIVGLTFKQFIDGPEQVKVLFLYSENEGCSTCKDVHDIVVEAAKKLSDRSKVAFGALDLFKNDHQLLQEFNVPVVLVFAGEEERVRLEDIDSIKQLEEKIRIKLGESGQL